MKTKTLHPGGNRVRIALVALALAGTGCRTWEPSGGSESRWQREAEGVERNRARWLFGGGHDHPYWFGGPGYRSVPARPR